MHRILTFRRPAAGVLLALAATITIAACGGSGTSGSGSASTGDTALKFAACVRAHGVPDYPDPSSTGGEQVRVTPNKMTVDGHTLAETPTAVQRAMTDCRKYSPTATGPATSAAQLTKLKAGALAMAKCMRANGVPNFPDPQVGTGPGGHGVSVGIRLGSGTKGSGGGINPNSPAFRAAQKKCNPLMTADLPGGRPGAKGTSG